MMKSSFYVLLLGILIASLVLPVATLAATAPVTSCKLANDISYNGVSYGAGSTVSDSNTAWGIICFLNMMNIVINIIFIGLMILVIIMVLLGAFKLMTAAGDTAKVTAGRNQIMYAAIGLIVALVAKAVPSIVSALFG
jgi:hypothetical protein